MKCWCPPFVLLTLLTLLLVPGSVSAQDAGMSDSEIVGETDAVGEKMIYAPGEEVRYIPKAATASPARDSVVLYIHDFPMQQATMKSPETAKEKVPAKQKDDSILTFNFLYYIIQKYKLQDIID